MIRRASWSFALLLFLNTILLAGTTGKISGRISDAKTGEGLVGVDVQLEGTALGAATDADGVFIILNVPPGLYSLLINYLGYQGVKVKDIRVNVDFTTRVNQSLNAALVEGEVVEVLGERNPLVRQDLTNTTVAVTSEQLESLPVDQIRDVIALQAGIVEDNSGNLHIRGGRSNEVAFQVNGVSINNPFSSTQAVGIATNAVEEVSVSTGTFSAEYGNALSGVINFVTKDGGNDYNASLRMWTGDHVSNNEDIFFNIDDSDPFNNSRAEWTLSGPVPLFNGKLTFLTSGVYQNDKGHLYGLDLYKPEDMLDAFTTVLRVDPFGLGFGRNPDGSVNFNTNIDRRGPDGTGETVPMVTFEGVNLTGRLTWKPVNSMKFGYDIIMDDGNRYSSTYYRRFRFTPDGRPQTKSRNISHAFGLTHTLSKSTFYNLRFAANFTSANTSLYDSPSDPRYLPVVVRTGDNVDDLDFVNDPDRLLFGNTGYQIGGQNLSFSDTESRSMIGKLDFVSQVHPSHELKFGGEVALHQLDLDAFTLQFDPIADKFFRPTEDKFVGFQFYRREPRQGAMYILDKMELTKRFILNAGLRYEYLDANALYNPDLVGSVNDPIGADNPALLKDAEIKHRLSPRASLSFPITAEGIIRFSYGIFYQNPTFSSIYTNPRFFDGNFGQFTPSFGNANLEPQRSIQYEMGLQQQFGENMKVDLTIFYKDVTDLIQTRRILAGPNGTDEFNVLTNISYASVKGFTASFLSRRSTNGLFSATLDYTFQVAEGAFDDPLRLFIDANSGRQGEQEYVPLDFDRTHTLNATMTIGRPRDWIVSAIGRLQAGTPYTPSLPSNFQAVNFDVNSDRRPWFQDVDLKLEKYLKAGPSNFSLFLQVENLFDLEQERFIHTNTGRSLTNLNTVINPALFNQVRNAIRRSPEDFMPIRFIDDFYQREDWLGEPREVRIGMSFEL